MSVEIPSDCSRTRQIRFKCRLKSLHCGDTGGMERRGRGRRDRARPSTRCDCRVSVGSARLIRSGLPGHPSVSPSVRSFPPYSLPRSFIRRLRSRRDSPRLSLSLALADTRRPPPIQIRSNFKRRSNQRRTDFTGRNFGWRRSKLFFITLLRSSCRARVKSGVLFRFFVPASRTPLYYGRSCKFALLWIYWWTETRFTC